MAGLSLPRSEPLGEGPAHPFFSQLGLALRILRERARMTVTALAHEARIGKSQLSKYENGHERPKVETLAKLLEVLKVEPLWFFYLMHQLSREQHAQALRIDLFTLGIPGSPVSQTAAEGFNRVLESLFGLHAIVIEERITQMNGPVRHHEGWTPG